MKKYIFNTFYTLLILSGLCLQSCTELDLTQKDAANSGTWYQTKDQFRQSLNESYREVFWPLDEVYEGMDDDWQRRDVLNAIKELHVYLLLLMNLRIKPYLPKQSLASCLEKQTFYERRFIVI